MKEINKHNYLRYQTQVWLFTLILSPIFYWVYIGIIKNEPLSSYPLVFPILFTTLIAGIILSIPGLIMFWLINLYSSRNFLKMRDRRILLTIFLIFFILITTYLVDESVFYEMRSVILPLTYIIVGIVCICILKFERIKTVANKT